MYIRYVASGSRFRECRSYVWTNWSQGPLSTQAPLALQVEREYKDKVNFVMLNIENRKWAPEIAEYRVGGVPHFVFLDSRGQAEAAAVGRLPQKVGKRFACGVHSCFCWIFKCSACPSRLLVLMTCYTNRCCRIRQVLRVLDDHPQFRCLAGIRRQCSCTVRKEAASLQRCQRRSLFSCKQWLYVRAGDHQRPSQPQLISSAKLYWLA